MRTFLFFKIFFKKVLSENFGSWPPLKFWSHDAPGKDISIYLAERNSGVWRLAPKRFAKTTLSRMSENAFLRSKTLVHIIDLRMELLIYKAKKNDISQLC